MAYETPDMPTVKLTSGLVVANFSFSLGLIFDDGSQLSPCNAERCRFGRLKIREEIFKRHSTHSIVQLKTKMTDACEFMLLDSIEQQGVDLILLPESTMVAVMDAAKSSRRLVGALKVCAVPITRQYGECYHDRFQIPRYIV